MRRAILLLMALLSLAQLLGVLKLPGTVAPAAFESGRFAVALALLHYSKHRRRGKSLSLLRSSTASNASALVVLLVLSQLATPVRADGGISIGTIITVVSTIWGIISTVGQVIIWIIVIIEFSICYTIAFCLAAFIFVNTLDAFGTAANFSLTQWIERRLLEALQCEPVDPEYGVFRPEFFNDAPRPSPVPYVVQRKRSDPEQWPSTSPPPDRRAMAAAAAA